MKSQSRVILLYFFPCLDIGSDPVATAATAYRGLRVTIVFITS